MQRDNNGYAVLIVKRKKYYITPYNQYYAVRDKAGSIVRNEENKQLLFASENAAINYLNTQSPGNLWITNFQGETKWQNSLATSSKQACVCG